MSIFLKSLRFSGPKIVTQTDKNDMETFLHTTRKPTLSLVYMDDRDSMIKSMKYNHNPCPNSLHII